MRLMISAAIIVSSAPPFGGAREGHDSSIYESISDLWSKRPCRTGGCYWASCGHCWWCLRPLRPLWGSTAASLWATEPTTPPSCTWRSPCTACCSAPDSCRRSCFTLPGAATLHAPAHLHFRQLHICFRAPVRRHLSLEQSINGISLLPDGWSLLLKMAAWDGA